MPLGVKSFKSISSHKGLFVTIYTIHSYSYYNYSTVGKAYIHGSYLTSTIPIFYPSFFFVWFSSTCPVSLGMVVLQVA